MGDTPLLVGEPLGSPTAAGGELGFEIAWRSLGAKLAMATPQLSEPYHQAGGTSERAYDVQLHTADIRAYRRVGKCFPNLHGDVDMFLSKGETEYLLASTLHLSFSTGIIFGQSI